jgi:hypothetical protein
MRQQLAAEMRRPSVMLVMALLALAFVPVVLMDLAGDVQEERALSGPRDCATTSSPCLSHEQATLEYANEAGRRSQPSIGVTLSDGTTEVVFVVPGYDSYLDDRVGEDVDAWLVGDDVVAVGVGGTLFQEQGAGLRGAVSDGFAAAFLLSFAAFTGREAFRNRRRGWDTKLPPSAPANPVFFWLVLTLLLPVFCFFSGAPISGALIVFGVGVVAVAAWQVWRRVHKRRPPTSPGKHARLE